MVSVLSRPMRYPLWRRRIRPPRELPVRIDTRRVVAAGIVFAVLGLIAFWLLRPAHVDARRALDDAVAAIRDGEWTAARDAALRAAAADPASAAAQAVLARAYLELGDGVAAEGAIGRAVAAGMAPARLHQLNAHARLLQGDEGGAVAEAARAGPRYSAYAARVRARALAAAGRAGQAQAELGALLDRHPRDAAAWTDLGRIRLTAGDTGAASEAAGRAVALAPRDPAALTLAGEVLRTRYGLAAALPWFEAALRRDPGFHPALIEGAATLGEMGRYPDMLRLTRRAAVARPGSPQALYLQAVLAARAGQVALARRLLAHTGGAIDAVPGVLLLGGALDLAGGAPELAVAKWRQLLDAQPYNMTARRLLGTALLRTGDAPGALAVLGPLVARADADTYALAIAARAATLAGDRAGAVAFVGPAGAGMPGPSVVFPAGAALSTLQADVATHPASPPAMLALIGGLTAAGQQSGAVAAARHLADASPGAPAAQVALGDVLLAGGDAAGAAAAFARAASLRFDEATMLRLIEANSRAGRAQVAAEVLATFLAQNPDSVAALRLVGHWQVAGGQWSAAVRSLERVRQRVGNRDAALLADLALAYDGLGDTRARNAAVAARRLAPINPAVRQAVAVVLAR
jgi:tetratricopeptide (TPR) repeat protein